MSVQTVTASVLAAFTLFMVAALVTVGPSQNAPAADVAAVAAAQTAQANG